MLKATLIRASFLQRSMSIGFTWNFHLWHLFVVINQGVYVRDVNESVSEGARKMFVNLNVRTVLRLRNLNHGLSVLRVGWG